MTTIAEGHEDCGRSVDRDEIRTMGGELLRTIERVDCHHDHQERLYASDDLGIEYPVARYCLCCDTLTERF